MKNTIKSILLPLLYSFSGVIVTLFVSMIYVSLNTYYYGYNTSTQLKEYFNSDIYKVGINNFLTNNYIYIGIIIFSLFIPYLLKKHYTENKKINKIKCSNYLLIMVLGVLVSGIASIVFYNINGIVKFTNTYEIPDVSLLSLIIVGGILTPIIEEYMFRGIIYKNLQKENSKMLSIIVTSILFAAISNSIDGMIYSFALSFLLIYVYEKYESLKAPIILHITSSIFQILLIYSLHISDILNYILLILFTILLVIFYIFTIRKDKKVNYGRNNKKCKN